ncbi:hypothetical protein BT93_H1462 [Corymbia citriodora subsp. variegata]|nr:hypothetical protein BT93_H1462 [Corymbia citriodora subsp. variegata]
MEDVKLHGAWTSPYSPYVIWALKLKGIPFEYMRISPARVTCCCSTIRCTRRSLCSSMVEDPFVSPRVLIFHCCIKLWEKIKDSIIEMLTVLEDYGPNKAKKFFGGDNINIVDIAFGSVTHWMSIIEEVSAAKIFDAEKFARLQCWMESFKRVPIICENLPDREKLLACLKHRREFLFGIP